MLHNSLLETLKRRCNALSNLRTKFAASGLIESPVNSEEHSTVLVLLIRFSETERLSNHSPLLLRNKVNRLAIVLVRRESYNDVLLPFPQQAGNRVKYGSSKRRVS
jgi:hypothetical protein